MLAAALSGIPTLAFEPNVVPGLANRVLAHACVAAAVHFEETCASSALPVTGVPVRRAFFDPPPKPAGSPPTLLVFGGSQGAHAINEAVMESFAALQCAVPGIHIIHQTGERDYNDAQGGYLRCGISRPRFLRSSKSMPADVRSRRPAGLPVGREHGGRGHRRREAGHLHSVSARYG